MDLGQEIKQSKFKNEFQKLTINLIYTSNILKTQSSNFLKKYDLTSQQYNILRILRGQYPNPSSVNLITERMLDKQSNASRLIDKLLAKNLVMRTENEKDRRIMDVVINQSGLDLLSKIDPEFDKLEESFTSITVDEAKKMNAFLDKFRDSFNSR